MKHCCTALLALALVCTEARADDTAPVSAQTDATAAPVTDLAPTDAGTPAESDDDDTAAPAPSEAPAAPTTEGEAKPADTIEGEAKPVDTAEKTATDTPATDTPAVDEPVADKPVADKPAEAAPAAPVEEGFSLEKKVVPWVTLAAGVLSVVGAAALITAGGIPFYAVWDLDQKLVKLESEDPDNIERAKLLQQSSTLRRKEWNQYGAPLVTSGVVLLVAGGVFIAGGLITGMGLMDGAE